MWKRCPTVVIMHLLNLPTEPIPLHHIVVEFIPPRRGRESGAWVFGQRGEVEAVDEAVEGVEGCEEGGGGEERCVHFCVRSNAAQETEMGQWDWGSQDKYQSESYTTGNTDAD